MAAVTITLKKKEILYDIENATYLVGLNRNTGSNFEQVNNIQNSGENEDRNFVLRSVETAFNEVKRLLNRFISETSATSNNDLMTTTADFTLALTMPAVYNQAAVDSMKSACHEYIVSSTLIDWFSNVKPDEVAVYVPRKQAAEISILASVYKKKAPSRPA